MSSTWTGCAHADTPDVCDMRCLTSTASLPLAANSGQYFATGAYTSNSPRSASTRAASDVMVFVVDHTLVIVCSDHGSARPSSAHPPQMSTTGDPSTVTATDAPRSSPLSTAPDSTSERMPNGSLQNPLISAMCPFLTAPPTAASESFSPARTLSTSARDGVAVECDTPTLENENPWVVQ